MQLTIYNQCSHLKLFLVIETHFAFIAVMFKRFKLIWHVLESMVLSEWVQYRKNDIGKTRFIQEKMLDENW